MRDGSIAEPHILPSADLDDDVRVGDGSSIWHLAQVRGNAKIGESVIVGRGVYIGSGMYIGDNCEIQNYALVYEPTHLENGVFVGPAAVLTNDTFPHAVNPDGTLRNAHDWEPVGMTLKRGSSVGARTVCVAPVTIGEWATVAADSVVTRDVPAYALVAGVPTRHAKWMGRSGFPLKETGPNTFRDPHTGDEFKQVGETLNLVEEVRWPSPSFPPQSRSSAKRNAPPSAGCYVPA